MRITLLAANGYLHDRRARALHAQLDAASHDVTVVAAGAADGDRRGLVPVPARRPIGPGRLRALLRRAQPASVRSVLLERDLAAAAAATTPDLVVPTTTAAIAAATRTARDRDVPVLVDPGWDVPADVSLVERAPARPDEAASVHGGLDHHTPGWGSPAGVPTPGRHAGRRLLLVHRRRATSPGRYLEEALVRAGVDVLHAEDHVDAGDLPPRLDGVVVVESPYPAVRFDGRPPCPVVFWVHHGEHHLSTNLRLAARYGADHVLLAHSWHLAHRFDVPVTRFPFGAPVQDVDGGTPWARRRHDVAMVGSHLDGGGPYARRGELVARARTHLGADRCAFRSDIGPDEMLAVYADSRLVLNDGGTRHQPITMRVLEAVAAGALLVTDHCPGLELLLPAGRAVALAEPFEEQLDALLADPASGPRAAAARDHARVHHTYDHRVDELLGVLGSTAARTRQPPPMPDEDTLGGLVARDAEVQRLVQVGADELASAHPDREVWRPEELGVRLQPGTIEAVAIRGEDVSGLEDVIDAAWRYLYVDGPARGLEEHLAASGRSVDVERRGGVRRIDLRAPGYVVRPEVAP